MSADRLIAAIDQLKFAYKIQGDGSDPTVLLLPKRKSYVRTFCEDLHEATGGEAGSVMLIFDRIWREQRPCTFRDLEVHLYDGEDMGIVGPMPGMN